ncbi:hypothetical protein GCM10009819_10960 [Agromyces tropicus]|uniref:DUF559 domain-containing protein n=1 Tax=Agromyces tropicus TaxID=555371 RepID=A0ABP5FNA8_9MICO
MHWRRLVAADLEHVFHGVRRHSDPAQPEVRELAEAYAKRMPRRQVFSHATAAVLWGIPLPADAHRRRAGGDAGPAHPILHVSVPSGSARPAAQGIHGHVISFDRVGVLVHGGLRVVDPGTAWVQLGGRLRIDDLVAAAEFLVTGSEPFDGRPPLCTSEELHASLEARRGARGMLALRAALADVRWGALSRRETLLRLDLVRAGLPEPVPNHRVLGAAGELIAMIDLAYPDHLVGIEYQGDHHRAAATWRRDVRRLERLADLGWAIVQATSDDVGSDGRVRDSAAFARRVAGRLAAKGWRG